MTRAWLRLNLAYQVPGALLLDAESIESWRGMPDGLPDAGATIRTRTGAEHRVKQTPAEIEALMHDAFGYLGDDE